MITDKDIHDFTFGDCYLLAREIANQSNGQWKMVWVKKNEWHDGHAFCVSPDWEEAIDVEGKRPLRDLLNKWKFTMVEIQQQFDYIEEGMFPSSPERAKIIAEELINA